MGSPRSPTVEYFEPEYEGLSEAEIRALQLDLFRRDLERVWRANRFYARAYYETALAPSDIRRLEDVRRLPTVRKADVLADAASHPPFGERLQVQLDDVVEIVESSGTTGQGREAQALTASDVELVNRAKMFQFFWVGCRKGTVVALHLPVTMAAGALWSLRALQRLGSNVLRLGNMDVEARLRYMKHYDVEVTAVSTSYIMRLEYAAEQGRFDLQADFPHLRSVYVGSGGWTIAWAQERAARWNARLFEVYGSSQRAFALTCEWGIVRGSDHGVMHFLPHLALTEVVNRRTGEHVAPGEEGEIVITPFGQQATPLIRYATGDRARFMPAGECPCGRAFSGIQAGSVGRYDDMLRLKELNVWPETIDSIVLGKQWVAEYRGDVFLGENARETARIQVEFRPGVGVAVRERLLHELAGEVRSVVGLRFACEEWTGPSLLSAEETGFNPDSLKIRRWTDRRSQAQEGRQ